MATRDYWAEAPMNRRQTALFNPTLDSMISEDVPVRLFDEVLAGLDWSSGEAEYDGTRGQPPSHPRFMSAALVYGLCRGIRSSRKLEEAMSLGLIRLGDVTFDGTRVKANNSRFRCRTAQTLEEKLQALDKLFEEMLEEAQAADAAEASQSSSGGDDDNSPTQLPGDLADLKQRRERVREALNAMIHVNRFPPSNGPTCLATRRVDCITLASCTMPKQINTIARKANRCPF